MSFAETFQWIFDDIFGMRRKPRITMFRFFGAPVWKCSLYGREAYGVTPTLAYRSWLEKCAPCHVPPRPILPPAPPRGY